MRTQTFVIRHPSGGFYTQMSKVGSEPVKRRTGEILAWDDVYRPQFDGRTAYHASQFGTVADAEQLMADPEFGGPESFAGCVVVPSE